MRAWVCFVEEHAGFCVKKDERVHRARVFGALCIGGRAATDVPGPCGLGGGAATVGVCLAGLVGVERERAGLPMRQKPIQRSHAAGVRKTIIHVGGGEEQGRPWQRRAVGL